MHSEAFEENIILAVIARAIRAIDFDDCRTPCVLRFKRARGSPLLSCVVNILKQILSVLRRGLRRDHDIVIAMFMSEWRRVRALLLTGLGMASACAQSGTAPIVIDYPAGGSVFPPDMAAPTFLWRDPAPGAVSWRIDVSFADGSAAIHVTAKGERMRIGEIDPRCD